MNYDVPNSIGAYSVCFSIPGISNDSLQISIPYYQHKLYIRICNYVNEWTSWTKLIDEDS